MLLIGIDEAGYGPLLGPLCHGLSVFRVPDAADPPDLWERLAPAVSRHPAPAGAVAVDDSKAVYGGADKFHRLSFGVMAFKACESRKDESAQPAPESLETILHPEDCKTHQTEPWGSASREPSAFNGGFHGASEALSRKLRARKIELRLLQSRALTSRDFNLEVHRSGNKADVNWMRAGALLRLGVSLAKPGEHVHATIDRQGGRKFYAAALSELFDGTLVGIVAEEKSRSVYMLDLEERTLRVEFAEKADSLSLPVALASMAAKLTREICMARMNAFFRSHDPSLAPTAGYYTDAQRFLSESAGLRKRLKIDDEAFVRIK